MKKIVFILLPFFAAIICQGQKKEQSKPNIIFFLVDDMGWQETSVPFHSEATELNYRYNTPNMERLANRGMKFTQAYAAAVCSPSRISLMTGLNSARHKVTCWTLIKDKSPSQKLKAITEPDWNVNGISTTEGVDRAITVNTLPQLLKQTGYQTIHVGKAHFGAKDTPGENPLNLGFDVNIAGHAAGGPGSYYGTNNFSAAFRNGDLIWDIPGLEVYHGKDIYLNEALTIKANNEINKAVSEKKPFYLYMSHYAIHAPWEKDPRFYYKYKAMGLTDFQATYASMVESMDKSLGDIMQNIRKQGIEDNTIIVFMSDNGQPSKTDRNLPLRGHKLLPYEGGVRVPLIVHWPGVTQPGSVSKNYMIIEDIFPTFLEMAGVRHYKQKGGPIDGKSIVPFLEGKTKHKQNRPIFWHYPNTYGGALYFPYSSMRKGNWKLVYRHAGRELELYNLKDDLGEKNDLAKNEPEKLIELSKVLSNFLRESEAQMPTDNRTGKTVAYPDALFE